MRVELRDEQRRRIDRVEIDQAERPTRVTVETSRGSASGGSSSTEEVYLNWDRALDDAGHLRRCIACGCPALFREKAFPQVTGVVVIMAFAGAVYGTISPVSTPMLIAMAAVLVFDVAILIYSKRRLVCYRCRSAYHGVPVARYHRPWDRAEADRHPAPSSDLPGTRGDLA